MRTHVVVVARSTGLVLLLATAAACGPGAIEPLLTPVPATASPAISPPASPPSSISPTEPGGASPSPTPAGATRPPVATLAGVPGPPVAGDEGTFSWDGLVSDAPWVVGPARGAASVGQPLEVTFEPAGTGQATWQSRWAPVTDGVAGDPVPGGRGGSGQITLLPPDTPGTWSLQLTAMFGTGRSATWYWQLEVRP
jgi:hypothetical protein